MPTKIEWCDEVWNPSSGCTKVSAGCAHCYAERIANRFWWERMPDFYNARKKRLFTDVREHPERLDIPLRWKKPRRIFVDSMSDLFHLDVPIEFVDKVFEIMHLAYWHIFIILTKRPQFMARYILFRYVSGQTAILPNVWLGVSVENQQTADERIPLLLKTPAAVRFASYEPALGPVDLHEYICKQCFEAPAVDWVIAGCESGPGARPADIDWFRSVRDQCKNAGVPFFLKQTMISSRSRSGYFHNKLIKMPELDGKVWAEFPR